MDTSKWCELCRHRQAEREKRLRENPVIVAEGGFRVRSIDILGGPDPGCYPWPEKPLKWYRKRYGWRQGKREWLEDQEFAGQMVHAFVPPIELPEISARRGGITYGKH